MKITPNKCPECGETVRGTIEHLAGCAQVLDNEDGTFEYEGRTEIWWDEQRTAHEVDGRVHVICPNGHEWPATLEDEENANPAPALN